MCGREASWAAAVLGPALAALDYLESHALLESVLVAHLRAALDARSASFACSDPRLLHGDLGAKHILVDPASGDLAAIIDFGDREAGDGAWDLGNFWVWEDDRRLAYLLEGYSADLVLRCKTSLFGAARSLRLIHKRYRQGRTAAADDVLAWLVSRIPAIDAL